MKMMGKKKLSIALIGLSAAPLFAQDQSFPGSQPTVSQAGSVSVDMVTGEPIQVQQATAILAIYRGPGYFDESLLEIADSMPSGPAGPPSSEMKDTPPSSDDANPSSPPSTQSDVLPPPPMLPPMPEGSSVAPDQDSGQGSPPAFPVGFPQDQPPPPVFQDSSPSQSQPELEPTPPLPALDTPVAATEGGTDEPLPPPPMLETLPAFPQGE